MDRDEIVVEMFESIRGMVYNFARRYELEFDDCLQDASLIMLEVWPKIPVDCTNVKAYLNGVVRKALYQRLRTRSASTMSLDAPITADSIKTFADMLEAFTQQDTQRADNVAKTVHRALHGLSFEVQLHARDFYQINSYRPRMSGKVKYGRKKTDMRQSLRVAFRQNPQVLALMQ